MTCTKAEIFSILEDMLGENVEGIFIPSSEYEWGDSDEPAASQMSKDNIWDIEDNYACMVSRGATKVVLIPRKGDFVIKLNITGTYLTEGECEHAGLEYPYVDRRSTQDILDYEIALYDELPMELKSVVKPNIHLGTYCGQEVYVQEKISASYEEVMFEKESDFKKAGEEVRSSVDSVVKSTTPAGWRSGYFPEPFVADMIAEYGEEFTQKVLSQIGDSGIYDLNPGNFGYDADNKPCIFDTGGFEEDEFFEQIIDYYNTDWGEWEDEF